MIGRTKEFERAHRLMGQTDQGACLVVIEGPAGIGKTTVHEGVVASFAERGATVLRCRPLQNEVALARSGLLQLMDPVDAAIVNGLPAPQRRALRVALRWDEPDGGRIEAQTLAAALTAVVRTLAGRGRLLIALDDLQWLDMATGLALAHAVRRLDEQPIAVLASRRTPADVDEHPIERAVDPSRVDRILLGPMPSAAIRQMLSERLDLDLTASEATRLATAAAGNPLVALELGRIVVSDGMPAPGDQFAVPKNVRDLIGRRLAKLPARTRAALLQASAMAAPSAPPLDVRALAPAEAAGIVSVRQDQTVVFAHPLYESAIYRSISAPERLALHARLARAVTDVEERAHHLALSADAPNAATANAIAQASEVALDRGAFDHAIHLAERAWQLTPAEDRDTKATRAIAVAEINLRAGRAASAVDMVARILSELDGVARGHALMIAGEAQMWTDSPATAIASLEEALTHLRSDPVRAATTHLCVSFLHHQILGDWLEGARHADIALAVARSVGTAFPYAETLAADAIARWFIGQGDDRVTLDLAVAAAEPTAALAAYFRPDAIRAIILGYCDEIAEAVAWFDAEVARARTLGRSSDMSMLTLVGIPLAALHGDVDVITRCVSACRDAAGDEGSSLMVRLGTELSQLALAVHQCDRSDGQIGQIRQRAALLNQRCVESGVAYLMAWLPATLSAFELAVGDGDAALEWLEPALAPVETPGVPIDPGVFCFVPNGCEALVLTGRLDRARLMIDRYEAECTRYGRVWAGGAVRRARALLHSAEGRLGEAAVEAAAAVEILSGTGFRLEEGRARLVAGQIARRRRQRAAAREQVERAVQIFADAGCVLWQRLAEDELGRTWGAGPGLLSGREAQVAQLAAQGASNPQIAASLFVSRRTVEATLSNVYRKLGITGRTQLASALHEQ